MVGLRDSDVLNDELFIKIASKIDDSVTPVQLSVYLGFEESQGKNAQTLSSDRQSAYVKLLRHFVSKNKNGKDGKSALELRIKFLEKNMVPCVELVEKELKKYGIVPSRADKPIDLPSNQPSPSYDTPEVKKAGTVIPSPTDTLPRDDVNPPSLPHGTPGSETPLDTHGRETPSNSDTTPTYLIVTAGIVTILAMILYILKCTYDPSE